MYTMTDICLLVYFLPHVSLCGFIRYLMENAGLLETFILNMAEVRMQL